ncbi:MAG: Crp/Fnr family transcriptional regulator [Anaerolineae bacterium]
MPHTLKTIPLFQHLPDSILTGLAANLKRQTLAAGEVLFHQGDPGDALYVIISGRVKIVFQKEAGEEVVLSHFGPGEFFGELALIDQKPRSAGVVALSPVDLFELKRRDFLAAFNRQPALALGIMQSMAARLRFASVYLSKAVAWSEQIAAGNYHSAMHEIEAPKTTKPDVPQSDEARAAGFLAAFFEMVSEVQEREETLKQTVQQLRIEIDEVKRARQVSEITKTEYFKYLKEKARQLKRKP